MFHLLQTGVACLCLLKMSENLPVVFFKKGVLKYFAKSFLNKVAGLRPKHPHINWKFQRTLKLSIESFNIRRTFFKKIHCFLIFLLCQKPTFKHSTSFDEFKHDFIYLFNTIHGKFQNRIAMPCWLKKRFSSRWLLIWNTGLKIQIAW